MGCHSRTLRCKVIRMNRSTVLLGLTMALLALALGTIVFSAPQSDADEDINIFSGTASEIWPAEEIDEYTLTGPLHVQIMPDEADGYTYTVLMTILSTIELDVQNGGIDSSIHEPGYVNIVLQRSNGFDDVELRTISLEVTMLSPSGSIIYGGDTDYNEWVAVDPVSKTVQVGDTYSLSMIDNSPNDPAVGYIHSTRWNTIGSGVVTISPVTGASTTVTAVGGGSDEIVLRAVCYEAISEGRYAVGQVYAYSDVTVESDTYSLTVNFLANPRYGGTTTNLPEPITMGPSATNSFTVHIPDNNVDKPDIVHENEYTQDFVFLGYSVNSADTTIMYEADEDYTMSGGTMNLYPIYRIDTTYHFKLIYTADGATNVPGVETHSDSDNHWSTRVSSQVPVKEGYTFVYWVEDDKQYKSNSSQQFTNGVHTLEAVFVPNYTVTIESSDATKGTVSHGTLTVPAGTTFTSSGATLTVGETAITATPKTGYSFVSWSPASGTISEDMTITATFETASTVNHVVTIQANNVVYGEVSKTSSSVTEGTAFTTEGNTLRFGNMQPITATANPGYRFVSWSPASGTISEDMTITAVFEPISDTKVSVTIELGDWSRFGITINRTAQPGFFYHTDTINFTPGVEVGVVWLGSQSKTVTGEGYTCTTTYAQSSWSMSSTPNGSDELDVLVVGGDSPTTIYPKYTMAEHPDTTTVYNMTYDIYFDANGGTGAPAAKHETKTDSTLSEKQIDIFDVIPTNGNRQFLGWAESSTSTTPDYTVGHEYSFSCGEHHLVAVWSSETPAPTTYTVSYYYGNVREHTETVTASGTIQYQAPAKEGKNFVGWFTDRALTQQFNVSTPVTQNMELYAKYEDIPAEPTHEAKGTITPTGAPRTYKFDATPSGDFVRVEWHFGDSESSKSTDSKPTYTYEATGSYTVTLKVWFEGQNEPLQWTQTLNVSDTPSGEQQDNDFPIDPMYLVIGIIAVLVVILVVVRI